tara:strand:- start:1807 stop:2190 length:384 start_codon:yes stop_codon:yes gene_type:complete
MQVDIITPEKIFFTKKNISIVTIPAIEGQMGVLDDHLPIITFLKPGMINIGEKENQYFFTTGGVVDFKSNFLSILCQEIYSLEDLSDKKIKELSDRAKKKTEKINSSDKDIFLSFTLLDELKALQVK